MPCHGPAPAPAALKALARARPTPPNRAERAATAAKDYGLSRVDVLVNGVGSGRESAIRALGTLGIAVASIKDVTGIPMVAAVPKGPESLDMARNLTPIVKLSRREQTALHPKAIKGLAKHPYKPGQHGPTGGRNKPSQYAIQLREKQKVKRMYGLLEKQFAKVVHEAERRTGNSGDIMLNCLSSVWITPFTV